MKNLLGFFLVALMSMNVSSYAQVPEKTGVTGAAIPSTTGTVPGRATEVLYVGTDVYRDERVRTDSNGRAQLLFLDDSRISIGPNSEVVLNRYRYDPSTRTGQITASIGPGIVRVAAGAISQTAGAVSLPVVNSAGEQLASVELNGEANRGQVVISNRSDGARFLTTGRGNVTIRGKLGQTVQMLRSGFLVTISPQGLLSAPTRAPPQEIDRMLSELEGRTGTGQRATAQTLDVLAGKGSAQSLSQTSPDQLIRSLRTLDPRDLDALSGLRTDRLGDIRQRGFIETLPRPAPTIGSTLGGGPGQGQGSIDSLDTIE